MVKERKKGRGEDGTELEQRRRRKSRGRERKGIELRGRKGKAFTRSVKKRRKDREVD